MELEIPKATVEEKMDLMEALDANEATKEVMAAGDVEVVAIT
jgi:hypothetical protein